MVPWNKGLSKKTDKRIEKYSIKVSKTILKLNETNERKGKAETDELELLRRQRISETMKERGCGGYRKGAGRGKKCWYESKIAGKTFLDSSYELILAKFFDSKSIKWKKNYNKFHYIFENKNKYYIPDFYLIDYDCYIETKGYFLEKDIAKWSYFPYKLILIFGEDLYNMGLVSEFKKIDLTKASKWRHNIPLWRFDYYKKKANK